MSQVNGDAGWTIQDAAWFHGVLPRDEVVRLLADDGDYLVRESRNRKTGEAQYVLSVKWQESKHFIIQGEEVRRAGSVRARRYGAMSQSGRGGTAR